MPTRTSRGGLDVALDATLAVGIALALAATTGAQAQSAESRAPMPFTEVGPRIEGDVVVVVALGSAADASGPLSARRLSARTAARARALALLHRFVDDALSTVRVSPAELRDAHAAIEGGLDLRRVRSLVDGSVLYEITVPLAPLRAAVEREGLPW